MNISFLRTFLERRFALFSLLRVALLALFTILLFVAFRPQNLAGTPQNDELITPYQYLPSLSYNPGLAVVGVLPTSVAVGVFGVGAVDHASGLTLTNLVANEFNMITVTPFSGTYAHVHRVGWWIHFIRVIYSQTMPFTTRE